MNDPHTNKPYTKKDYTKYKGTDISIFLKLAIVGWFMICWPVEMIREKTGWNFLPSIRFK